MQISELLSLETMQLLKSVFNTGPRVFKNKIRGQYDFIIPMRNKERQLPGGLPPSDLSTSSFALCIDHASVYGVNGGVAKMVRFEPPKPRKNVSA